MRGQIYAPAALLPGRIFRCQLNRKLDVPQGRSERFESKQKLLPLLQTERRFLSLPARSVVTMHTELYWPPQVSAKICKVFQVYNIKMDFMCMCFVVCKVTFTNSLKSRNFHSFQNVISSHILSRGLCVRNCILNVVLQVCLSVKPKNNVPMQPSCTSEPCV